MKKHLIYIIAALLLVGCSEQYDESLGLSPTLTPRYVNVTPTSLTYSSSEGSQSLTVTSMQTPWKMENGIDWVSVSPMSGEASGTVGVNVTENVSGDDARTGIFYLKANVEDWRHETPISVTQAGATPTITLSKTEFDFPGTPTTETVTVSANCSWSISSSADWLVATQQGSTISLSATSNESDDYRTATISVVHTGTTNVTKTITVRQAPASITASTEALVFNNTAGSVDVTITSQANWTASTSESWIEVSPTSGTSGSSTMKVSVSPNTATSERTGYVIVSIGGIQRIQIPVRQRGIYIETDKTELSFKASGGSLDLSVLSNTSWTVSTDAKWFTISPDKGEGDGKVTVTAQENPNTASRSGVIHLTQPGLNIDVSVTVKQEGKSFDVNTTVLNFNDKQETQTVQITTDGTWSAQASESWITLSPKSGSGNATLSITVSENTSDNERTGEVTVTMGDKNAKIGVVQKGKYFTVSNNLLTYTSKGGTLNVAITTNDKWTATVKGNSQWLKLSSTSGTGDIDVKVTAADNPSMKSRADTIVFATIHDQSIRVVVKQDARYLKVDTRELMFYAKGGTSEAITVTTDGAYSITCSDSWLTVKESGNTFTVTASENKTIDARTGYVTIALTDLKDDTYSLKLTVTQLNYGGSFLKDGYGDDVNYDDKGNTTGTLTITGFGSDSNYDAAKANNVTLTISNYKNDSNWDE